ncbi:G-type lectin S-receptor-like serine/threonine-protein kinase SD1-1 [Carica papaya]|uniref:G-type lectin S-receptor-like serine/threonine-protein kinase SD1-1 n=1 Tax=Carica papaya TaxID=3649 RepID=UPI000B8CDDE9|nr:G-type lectin S-receptor-like serine/threonine-protein kinase SD1-1 [Carica papaya]
MTFQNHKGNSVSDVNLPYYQLDVLSHATDDFSEDKKLGHGGSGIVYKGVLSSGKEIAVKRLLKRNYVHEELDEFHNEVVLLTNLQHRNLVKLLGFCDEGDEQIMVYEYMPNKSLNSFLFDRIKKKLLTWRQRLNIIIGVARGLLYLHQDSRMTIIHRDLKASNILLDHDLSPKISDFGIAKHFGRNQTEETTRKIVGTLGYISPEYALAGKFSAKSDVFSFGVLILEIISGKKNWGFTHPDHDLNLIGHAWKLWKEGSAMELMDEVLKEETYNSDEVFRCIQVGLLCVEHSVDDRPTMASVLVMLSNVEDSEVPQPKEPGFVSETYGRGRELYSIQDNNDTTNRVTITALDGR